MFLLRYEHWHHLRIAGKVMRILKQMDSFIETVGHRRGS